MKKLSILITALILVLSIACPTPASMYGAAGRRPQYWWDLGQNDDSALGGRLGTHVRASDGTFWDPDNGNQVTTVTDDILRHERKGGLRATLDEPAGTNLIHFSHELGNVASGGWWTNTNLTSVTANATTAPDGNVTADALVADVVNAGHYISFEIVAAALTDNALYTLSVFAKKGVNDWAALGIRDTDNVSNYSYFDLTNGVVGTTHDNDAYGIEAAANGFYRIWITQDVKAGVAAAGKFSLFIAEADGDATFIGDTASEYIYYYGAQLEESSVPTSHVPTSGATATRATESGYPLWTLPLGLFDAEGTASVWVRFGYDYDADPVGVDTGVVSVRDSAGSLLYTRSDLGDARSFDGATSAVVADNFLANVWRKWVIKWSSTTGKMNVGYDSGAGIVWGVEVAFDGSYTLGASLRLAFGLYGPMWLRDLRLYPNVLTDTAVDEFTFNIFSNQAFACSDDYEYKQAVNWG